MKSRKENRSEPKTVHIYKVKYKDDYVAILNRYDDGNVMVRVVHGNSMVEDTVYTIPGSWIKYHSTVEVEA